VRNPQSKLDRILPKGYKNSSKEVEFMIQQNMLARVTVDKQTKKHISQILILTENKKLHEIIMRFNHDELLSGHFGFAKTLARIQKYYYWPSIRKDVKEYIRMGWLRESIKLSKMPCWPIVLHTQRHGINSLTE
jgi:hypothetical protein